VQPRPSARNQITITDEGLSKQLRSDYFKVVKKTITESTDFSGLHGSQVKPFSQMLQPIVDKWWDHKKIQTMADRKSLQGLMAYLKTEPRESIKS